MPTMTLTRRCAALFPPAANPHSMRIGVELELLTFAAADNSVVPIERLRPLLSSPNVGFEPGGQLELSLPPAESLGALDRLVSTSLRRVTEDAGQVGVCLAAMPMDPRDQAEIPLQLHSGRYLAMQEHFDTIGSAGRVMMRRTASTQLCVDWWPGAPGLEQWRLAQLVGPALSAVFAAGDGSRLATWLAVDPARTAFDDRLLGADPLRAYVDFAAAARPFVEPEAHLTTLFPPVRPRRSYLEIRYLDSQPKERVTLAAAVLTALLYCDASRGEALRMLAQQGPALAEDWRTVAADPGDGNLLERGFALVDLAARAMVSAPRGYAGSALAGQMRSVARGKATVLAS